MTLLSLDYMYNISINLFSEVCNAFRKMHKYNSDSSMTWYKLSVPNATSTQIWKEHVNSPQQLLTPQPSHMAHPSSANLPTSLTPNILSSFLSCLETSYTSNHRVYSLVYLASFFLTLTPWPIPLCEHTKIYLSTLLPKNIWVVSNFYLLQIMLLWLWLYTSFSAHADTRL